MVKVLYLGLFAAIVCAFAASYASAGPVPSNFQHQRQHRPLLQHQVHLQNTLCNGTICRQQRRSQQDVGLADDGTVRSERSTNLSHITGSARKIQMFVKNWHLQILPDGVVNGTADDSSDYTILQRTTVNIGQLKIQGVATCQYLCMDSCGLLYASKDFMDECIFNEMIEQHHYNTYSSARYSNARRTMYLALNKWGQSRRVQIRAKQQLGKLSTYARVLTKTVSIERVEDLLTRIGNATGSHPLRHHGGLQTCTAVVEQKLNGTQNADWQGVDRLRCRKRKKRKKKRRRCEKQDGTSIDGCLYNNNNNNNNKNKKNNGKNLKNVKNSDKSKLCEHDNNSKKCQRLGGKSDLVTVNKKKKNKQKQLNANNNNNKSNGSKKKNLNGGNKKTLRNNNNKNNNRKVVKKVLPVFEKDDNDDNVEVDDITTIQNGDEYPITMTSTSESIEETSIDESTTISTSAMEDSEQFYDDDSSNMASSTQPSAEVDID